MKGHILKKLLTQPHVLAFATALISQVVAYVPKWAPEKQLLISLAGLAIGVAYVIADAIKSGKASPEDLAKQAAAFVQAEVGKVDLTALAKDALSGNAAEVVQTELRKVLSSGLSVAPAPAPVVAVAGVAQPTPAAPQA